MKLTLITVGKLKEKYWREAVKEYEKRLSKYASVSLIEIKDEQEPNNASAKDIEIIKNKEAERILSKIKPNQYVVTLEIGGKEHSSESFAKHYNNWKTQGKSNVVFVIGGSNGIGEEVLKRSNEAISFGKMTYPHQMMKVILLEQLFRVNKILNNEAYHR
ncbi:23S rRNA (pseudouridine(1915)-N(3))-methyltransferase RlmH [Nosocomiicoccus ampullae]|uniref:23S rRNA (pseudouridine(1915)-N(3))-methyltransferase RlmH n=1 Tax=Nosocomiicoccus ampullae TaxID=489910 RepID=UPI001C5E5881|nr:23S rRNA (pseudouridine(1915)-N(3))-methyltransferase RlmH [Nosocomiicoccus ampullae]QYA48502.1 23S rRNA (pseudouridine(1915)-N(3))-methyltransferase RlmH [Nosocomiicoccus ampullae]